MDKIVIVTSNLEKKRDLIEYLNMLFPECEIDIQYKHEEDFKNFPRHMEENAKIGIQYNEITNSKNFNKS